jgi:GNAT superfamily N-acetyltransferase
MTRPGAHRARQFAASWSTALSDITFRPARLDDAALIAGLHADSWRRHYRGAYADTYLDGDLDADRLAVWSARLATPDRTATIIATRDGTPAGFVHVAFDRDPSWGTLVDNLHVVHHQHRSGIGTHLLAFAAQSVITHAGTPALYLWVLEQNSAAQRFYLARGATRGERLPSSPPGGDRTRLHGSPHKFRMIWPDATTLARPLPS